MAQGKYQVVDGKHMLEDGTWVRKGDQVVLDEEVAAKFPGKFIPVMVPEAVTTEPTEPPTE